MLYHHSQESKARGVFKRAKFFSIDRIYVMRESMQPHLAEFHQVERVIADKKFREFHLSHQQKDQPHHAGQQQRQGQLSNQGQEAAATAVVEEVVFLQGNTASLEGDFKSSSDHNSLPLHPLSTPNPVVAPQVAEEKMAMGATTDATPSGMSGLWTRHPIIEGVRRNHSLIKVVLDTTTITGATAATATTTPGFKTLSGGRQANMKAGSSGEERISRDHARSRIAAATQEFYYTQQELHKKIWEVCQEP
ncbi:hypothetical protein BGX34_011899 [Mortierella sp. NVP85]|nr:hypothetical protein BGX34_011899 [Mortierella sp. NVP85]